ncbi:MAG: glutamate--tRNA ligase [Bacteroidia bacterium]|nr:glutamate--tRNA ligase [Bacteroidia bacterium]MDW8157906.1 glutamate--tRNA ligase [Bacteroidia bacterium]
MTEKVRVRFAPSPTGPLHVGGVRTALYNYLFAKHHGGDFIIRIEDTDQTRLVPGAEEYILRSLEWCGIHADYGPHIGGPDAPYRQSERKPIYKAYAEELVAKGHAYYAFDTPEQIEEMREKAKAAGNKSPQYNAITRQYMLNSLTLPAEEVQKRLESNEPYVIRMLVPRKEEIRFEDKIRGWVSVHSSQLDDKVLLKSDGMPTYHLANVVDDHLMKITHVIRGEEWLPSTPLHVLLYRGFGWEMPVFAHLPLLLSPDDSGKLSKRDGDRYGFPVFPLEWVDPITGNKSSGYKESGYLPEAFINFLAFLGWNPGTHQEVFSMQELIQHFSLERVGKSGVKFDKKKSIWYNQYYIRKKSPEELLPYVVQDLEKKGWPIPAAPYLKRVIELLSDRVEYLTDFTNLAPYFFLRPNTYEPELIEKSWKTQNIAFLIDFSRQLQGIQEWNSKNLEMLGKQLASEKGLSAGKIMPTIRLAVTGVTFGPGVFDILELLGKEETLWRIDQALQKIPVPTEKL